MKKSKERGFEVPLLMAKRFDDHPLYPYHNAFPGYSEYSRNSWIKYEILSTPHILAYFTGHKVPAKYYYIPSGLIKTQKFADFVFKTDPYLYFRWQHLDQSFLKLSKDPEQALLAAISAWKMGARNNSGRQCRH